MRARVQVMKGLDSLAEAGVNVKFVILDDGWQSTALAGTKTKVAGSGAVQGQGQGHAAQSSLPVGATPPPEAAAGTTGAPAGQGAQGAQGAQGGDGELSGAQIDGSLAASKILESEASPLLQVRPYLGPI